jgi:hypothetical protein
MYACKPLKIQGNLCIEFYAQKCERNSRRGRRIFIGFPDKFAKPTFYARLVGLDFTGDNRRGAPQRSNQCGDCYSTQKSVHKSGETKCSHSGSQSPRSTSKYRKRKDIADRDVAAERKGNPSILVLSLRYHSHITRMPLNLRAV